MTLQVMIVFTYLLYLAYVVYSVWFMSENPKAKDKTKKDDWFVWFTFRHGKYALQIFIVIMCLGAALMSVYALLGGLK